MDLKCLNYFVTVIEAGSFARASTRLRIAQPALGWQIRKLEDELGAQLLIRHSRGVEPTEAGLRLLGHARAILARAQEAVAELRSLAEAPHGTVVLGMTPSVNALLALPLFKRLTQEEPGIRVRPVEELSAVLTEWGANGRLDIAVGYPITSLSGLVCEPLFGESMYFVERARPKTRAGGTIPFAEAARHDLVLTVTSQRYRVYLEEIARTRGVEINIVHQMQSVATLRDLVIQGGAASILPLGAVAREVAAGTLMARRIVDPEINREVALFRPDSRPATKAEQIICALIRELADETMAASAGFWVPFGGDRQIAMSSADAAGRAQVHAERRAARAAPAIHAGKSTVPAPFDEFLRG
jgi:LysR family nitrogen assimilation transcriptional regulator